MKNLLAFLAGLVVGGAVNMGLVTMGPSVIPPPAGVDMSSAAGLAAGMPRLEPRHFVFPFLAHALGTLAGALVGSLLSATHRAAIAYAIGATFLAGGIAACFMIPAPAWFMGLDLVFAYIPMAWAGLWIGRRLWPRREGGATA